MIEKIFRRSYFAKWIRHPNSERMFMFKSKQALQKDILCHGITIAASATVDKMITVLSQKMQGLEGSRGRGEGSSE